MNLVHEIIEPLTEREWKDRFVAHIKKRFTGGGWTDADKEKVARESADACYVELDFGYVEPEQCADDEADAMAGEGA